jgi:hypothetical protein
MFYSFGGFSFGKVWAKRVDNLLGNIWLGASRQKLTADKPHSLGEFFWCFRHDCPAL